MFIIKEEKFKDCIKDLQPLLQDHYEEIALLKDKIKLNPDFDRYVALEEAGALSMVIARIEGEVVGYQISFIYPHIHYQDHLIGVNDIFYVTPEFRKTGLAEELLSRTENILKDKGVSVTVLNMKANHAFEKLCVGQGMFKTELVYSKYIGD